MVAIISIGGDPNKLNVGGYTKGDVLAADVSGHLQPVAVGPNADVLTADSVAAEGVDWQPGGGGGGGTPSNTVVTETSFGQASTAGIAVAYSRGDHTHGSSALGVLSTTAAAGNDSRFTLANGYYPLSGYGFCSISAAPETFNKDSTFDSGNFFLVRMWVPAGAAIVRVLAHLHTPSAFGGTANFNGAVVYDDTGTQVGISAATPGFWTSAGWNNVALTSPIAAQTVGRFVFVACLANGYPQMGLWYSDPGDSTLPLQGGFGVSNRRCTFQSGVNTPPASINPASVGALTGFIPPYALAST